jgi:transcriptional regulator with XRE-family HTH domain
MSIIFSNLKQVRERKLLSLSELALAAGLSRSTVVTIERGARKPQIETQRKLLAALGYDIKDNPFTDMTNCGQ